MIQMNPPLSADEQLFHPSPVNLKPFTEALIQFLQRADLKGAEVPTYAELWNVVQALQEGELAIVTAEQVQVAKDHARLWESAHTQLANLEEVIEADPELKAKVAKALIKREREKAQAEAAQEPEQAVTDA